MTIIGLAAYCGNSAILIGRIRPLIWLKGLYIAPKIHLALSDIQRFPGRHPAPRAETQCRSDELESPSTHDEVAVPSKPTPLKAVIVTA
jgi:hypothetical protein